MSGDVSSAGASTALPKIKPPSNEGNPAFRMLGLPRLRAKLPSRNWLIFLSITGSFTAAVLYDRTQKKRVQQKWCNAVAHLADQPLTPQQMPRRIGVFLEAPPGDYLLSAREHFQEYVKPILVAAAVDWELIEGRKEGDIRHKIASSIRNNRRKTGESSTGENDKPMADVVASIREKGGVRDSDDRGGDIVIGRHTWKEYVRGLHEGWLGPVDSPKDFPHNGVEKIIGGTTQTPKEVDATDVSSPTPSELKTVVATESSNVEKPEDELKTSSEDLTQPNKELAKDTDRKSHTDSLVPYVLPSSYPSSELSTTAPETFEPTISVAFPHLIGFLNTPKRLWRFLNRRYLADQTGESVVALLLSNATTTRSFKDSELAILDNSSCLKDGTAVEIEGSVYGEWQEVLREEEHDWHKSARKPNPPDQDDVERPWTEPIIIDARLGQRMRTIDLPLSRSLGLNQARSSVVEESIEVKFGTLKGTNWKGGADTNIPTTWPERLRRWFSDAQHANTLKPWQQGLESEE